MPVDRRGFLQLSVLFAGALSGSGCTTLYRTMLDTPQPISVAGRLPDSEFSALSRMTFGPRSEDLRFVESNGILAWVEEQLAPELIEDRETEWRVRHLDTIDLEPKDLDRWDRSEVLFELRQAALLRAVYSRRQIHELMVHFWSDHFNVSVEKGDCWLLKPTEEREVIRPHALDSFPELLWNSARSPAMLVYLDNQANHKDAPNENYARELLELHTLGVHGGYGQTDVMELARCLTGWQVKEHFWKGDFTFNEDHHDPGGKMVLGQVIAPGGQGEAETVIELLSSHPATAHQISVKLIRRFICDDPESQVPSLVEQVSDTYTRTNGDIRSVLRVVLLDGLGASPSSSLKKYKRPLEFVASALRLPGMETDGGAPVQDALNKMGQSLYAWPSPDGPSDVARHWISNLYPRWAFAIDLVLGQLEGSDFQPDRFVQQGDSIQELEPIFETLSHLIVDQRVRELFQESGRQADLGQEDTMRLFTAALISSPTFQWR